MSQFAFGGGDKDAAMETKPSSSTCGQEQRGVYVWPSQTRMRDACMVHARCMGRAWAEGSMWAEGAWGEGARGEGALGEVVWGAGAWGAGACVETWGRLIRTLAMLVVDAVICSSSATWV